MALVDETTETILDYLDDIVNNNVGSAPPYTASDMVAELKYRKIPKTYVDAQTRGGVRPKNQPLNP